MFLAFSDIWERIRTIGKTENDIWCSELSPLLGPEGVFYEPFDSTKDFTISQLGGLFTPKIDWLMSTRNLRVLETDTGGNIYASIGKRDSDHKWVFCSYKINNNEK